MKNWLPLVFGPAVRHRQGAPDVVALDRLVRELVPRATGPHAAPVERRLLAVLAVAALGHEARDDAVEDDVVVEALLRELDEVGGRLRGALVEQVDLDVADVGGDGGAGHGRDSFSMPGGQGLATVAVVIGTGFEGSSTPPDAT